MTRRDGEHSVLEGGPLNGAGYYTAELNARRLAFKRTGHGMPFGYKRTSRFGPELVKDGPPARIWTWTGGATAGPLTHLIDDDTDDIEPEYGDTL